jgi:hypothetical protein
VCGHTARPGPPPRPPPLTPAGCHQARARPALPTMALLAAAAAGLLALLQGVPRLRRDMMPRRSDVLLKSVEIHPGWRSGCDHSCNSTLATAAAFAATRIDWTFLDPSSGKTAAFLRAAATVDLPVSAAINANMPDRPDCENELNCTQVGRVKDLFGHALTLPWMMHWHDPPMYEAGAAGCVNSPDYERIKFQYIDSMLAAGVAGFIHDDWQMNTNFRHLKTYNGSNASFASGCYCEHCMRGFTEYLRGGNASSRGIGAAELRRLGVTTGGWSYRAHALHEISSCPHSHAHQHRHRPHHIHSAGVVPPPPPFCASAADHSKLLAAFGDFQRDSVGLSIARMMAHIRAAQKKLKLPRIAVACNGNTAPRGDLQAARETTGLSEFDYGMKEYHSDGSLRAVHALIQAFWHAETVNGKAQVLTLPKKSCESRPYKAADTNLIRESIAISYSAGGHMIVPWDNSLSTTGSCVGRYWGKASWYSDLYRFVRAQADLLDGYERAVGAGGVAGDMSGPTALAVRANSSGIIVLVRVPAVTTPATNVGVVHLVKIGSAHAAQPGVYHHRDISILIKKL